jgi:hypothetical protein
MDSELEENWVRKRLETAENLYLPTSDLLAVLFGTLLLLGALFSVSTIADPLRTRETTEIAAAKNPRAPTFEERWASFSRG